MSPRAAALAALFAAVVAAQPAAALEITCLPDEYRGDGLQLAVDGAGTLHLVAVGRIDGGLRHTTIAPDDGVTEAVIAPFVSRLAVDEVRDLGLALTDGGLHVCAYDAVGRRFDVWDDRDGWQRSPVDAGPRIGETCALAPLDDGLLVAWHGDGVLRAALRTEGGPWQAVDVDARPGADVGGQPAVAVGPGVVAIAHLDATAEVLRVSAAEIPEGAADDIGAWRWQTTALDAGGWSPAAFFDGGTLHVYHGGVPVQPDVESDVALFGSAGPPFGPFVTGVEPGFDLGGSLDAAAGDGSAWVFFRGRTRSALFGAFDGLYLDTGPVGGAFERTIIEESGPGGQRHTYLELQVALDPFGLPVLAWFDDAAGGGGLQATARTCYAREPDADGDAVPDVIEAALGTDPELADTDGDGRTDGEEILIDGTDPGGQACGAELCNGRDDDCDARIDEGLDGGACPTGAEGLCAEGRQVCLDGQTVCAPLTDAAEEQCSGVDEDCDGAIDEGAVTCGEGRCVVQAPLCVDGAPGVCEPDAPAADDGACDGVDDDCDGAVDEDYVPRPLECGVGRCAAMGETVCVGGVETERCDPGAPAAADGTCDGSDDDCDGATDEDAGPIPVRCGVGACARDGMAACIDGIRDERCAPGDPAPDDPCDGVDDDCDGALDEDHPVTPTACGAGPCAAAGESRCVGGQVVDTCRPGDGGPDDTCDGVDDDCDGAIDEGFGAVSTCGQGPCRAVADVRCVAGVPVDGCEPRPPLGSDDTCDGIDDDCDGIADEAAPARSTTCGVGACASEGAARCDGGLIIDDCVPGGPPAADDADCDGVDDDCDGVTDEGAECDCPPDAPGCGCFADDDTCDGVDDDCDGTLDEDFGARPLTCGRGACLAEGVGRCVDGAVAADCIPGEPAAADDGCDGIDDDCDGATDEDFPAGEITCGTGICAAVGTLRCVDGRRIERCRPGPGRGNDPICNGLDDDCDGTVDEGAAAEPIVCGVGACAVDGRRICRRGRYVDRCTPAEPAADDASCDGVDDDCDGQADEDAPSAESVCGAGACAAFGVVRCVEGALRDDCAPGAPAADDAVCDGVDDDCDGAVDEDYTPRVIACGVGACAASAPSRCVGGVEAELCVPGEAAADDATCDGVDDDCDGATDEDAAVEPITCGAGACLQAGERRCEGGVTVEVCTPGEPGPFDAECDGIDADCDGALDEDFVGGEQRCGQGACARVGRAVCIDGAMVDGPCAPGVPGDELCDGADGDCDGVLDEGCAADAGVAPTDAGVDAAAAALDAGSVDAAADLFVPFEPPDGAVDAGRAPDADALEDDIGVRLDAMRPPDATSMPDAVGPSDAMGPADAISIPEDTTVDASGMSLDAMVDGGRRDDAAIAPGRRDAAPLADGGLDRPDAVRLDYALEPLEDLVPEREFSCLGRITSGGSGGGWVVVWLIAGAAIRRWNGRGSN